MKNRPTILCITYGGIHPHLVAPVINNIKDDYNIVTIALTSSQGLYEQYGIHTLSVLDFFYKSDTAAKQYGQELLEMMQSNGEKIFNKSETVAYLGLSFYDLVRKNGYEKSKQLYKQNGRGVFNPTTLVTRIFDMVNPDLLLVTNSPRAEKAATFVAKERGIPSVLITDRFCQNEHYPFAADHICVTNQLSKNNLLKIQPEISSEIHITGNPFFDSFTQIRLKGVSIEAKKLRREILESSNKPKVFTWIDQRSYLSGETYQRHWRSDEEVAEHLHNLCTILTKLNIALVVRPHPSQPITAYSELLKSNTFRLSTAEDITSITQASDFVGGYTSTALISAYNLGKPVFVFNPFEEESYLPITENTCVFEIKNLGHLSNKIIQSEALCKHVRGVIGTENGDSAEVIADIIRKALSRS